MATDSRGDTSESKTVECDDCGSDEGDLPQPATNINPIQHILRVIAND
jgi:hypothetical protein